MRKRKTPKRKKKKLSPPKRLIRFLHSGEKIRVTNSRGRVVKNIRSNRNYIIEVRRKNKLIGYINNTKRGIPIASAFTSSMVARLKHTKREFVKAAPESGATFRITNRKRVKYQISNKMLREIKKNKGKAFGFRVKARNFSLLTPFVYQDGKMRPQDMRQLIASNLLMTLNQANFRISPLLKGQKEFKRIRRIEEAKITLNYIKTPKKRKPRKKVRKPKDR